MSIFSRHRAFLLVNRRLLPVRVRTDVQLDDLLGLDAQKAALGHNLHNFLGGAPYNHVLLWGARGTGKSSLARALYLAHADALSIVQISPDDVAELALLLWRLERQPGRFLVLIDDLSFSAEDRAYRALKSTLDGALCAIPANVLLLVTSNRRHLLLEKHAAADALHPEEDVEEQISLSERFGLRLAFHPLSQEQYLDAVAHWLGVDSLDADSRRAALQFALARGSRSARVAAQFVKAQ